MRNNIYNKDKNIKPHQKEFFNENELNININKTQKQSNIKKNNLISFDLSFMKWKGYIISYFTV